MPTTTTSSFFQCFHGHLQICAYLPRVARLQSLALRSGMRADPGQRPVFIGSSVSVGWLLGACCLHDHGGVRPFSISNWTNRAHPLLPGLLWASNLAARLHFA